MNVADWLCGLGLERYTRTFRDHEIDTDVLRDLTDEDLEKLGIPLGHRKRLLRAIAGLRAAHPQPAQSGAPSPTGRAPEPERRQLSVLFCDLVGSTELSAKLDPEDMSRVIRAYQDTTAEAVERWGGHVATYMGDGALVYFGWPQAHEDDAERAVRAGRAVVDAVGRLSPVAGASLSCRVGIATGLVMVGEGVAREQTVVGETPNLAARLQTLAPPGGVVISRATRRLLGGLFELTELGPLQLKGFAEPLAAWRVEGEGRAESRFEALYGARLTPLVGREHELGILWERWARATDGDGQVVLLSGEPGIGKSRVVRTLRERLSDQAYTLLSHYCSPYHTNSALYPVIGLLERTTRLDRTAPPEEQLARLEAVLGRSSHRLDEIVPLLAALLGIATDGRYPALVLTPEAQKRRTLQALVDQLEALAAQQPVLAVYEDVHWIDPSTLELLDLVVERIRQLPILLLITFRPEFQPRWTGQPHLTVLTMSRLDRQEGADLVGRVAGDKPLPAEIVGQIVARADGVPLFVEELTKAVLESGLLADAGNRYELSGPLPQLAIPTTLQDSLMARLDRLAPVREVAQIGAVIGREFSHELLAAVAPIAAAQLGDALEQLVGSELIFRDGIPPEATYAFKHALVQDAAYQSLLKTRRQQLHAHIADALEERLTGSSAVAPEVLAQHLTNAGLTARAIPYWRRAGELAAGRSANLEAIAHLSKGLELVGTLPEAPEYLNEELALRIAIGGPLMATKGYIAGKSVLIDPFWTGNPKHPQGFEDRLGGVDFIVLTHGHSDHLGDSARLARKYDATVVAMFEIVSYLGGQGVTRAEPMNIGGTVGRDGLSFSMVNALHSSAMVEDGKPVTMGDPAGFVIKGEGRSVYHAGDTEIFSDMALIQRIHRPKVGLIPIGDRFTMGPETAAMACNEFLDLEVIVPIHWGTFDLLSGDPQQFKSLVRRGRVEIPEPGKPLAL